MIWIFTADPDDYMTVARGVLIRSFHHQPHRHTHLSPITWSGQVRTISSAHSVCTGLDPCFRPGKPPHIDTIWSLVTKTFRYRQEYRQPHYAWDDVPWEIHEIEDDTARKVAYQAYAAQNGQPTADRIKQQLYDHLPTISMRTYNLVQEHA